MSIANQNRPIYHRGLYPGQHCRGFSLVELMVAAAIGLFLLAGTLQVFSSMKQANALVEHSSRIQETARFAVGLMTADLRRAGYWGGNADKDTMAGTEGMQPASNTCPGGSNAWGRMVEQRIFGLDDSNAGYACIADSDYLRGDVMTVRFATPLTAVAFNPDELYLRASLFEGRLFVGSNNADPANAVVDNPQSVHQLVAHAYFIGNTERSCNGKKIPALYWQTLVNGAPQKEELLTGVEHMQFQYGVDQNLDGVAEQYFNADGVTNWESVVMVRLWLLVRGECPDNSFTDDKTYIMGDQQYTPGDNFHRQLYSQTIALRNLLN